MPQPSSTTTAPRRRRARLVGATLGVAAGLASSVGISAVVNPPAAPSGPTPATPTPTASTVSLQGGLPTRRTSPQPSVTKTAGKVKVSAATRRGIVLIDASHGSTSSAGTGLIVTSSGQVLTNYHVVRGSTSIRVTAAETGHEYTAELIGRDAPHDVALLQLTGAPPLDTIALDPDPVDQEDVVIVAGNAGGSGELTAYAGRVIDREQSVRVRASAPHEPDEMLTGLIQTDAHAEPGDSGGPLFDDSFEVTGMTTAGAGASKKATSKTAYAMPIDDALAAAQRIRDGQEVDGVIRGQRAELGATYVENKDGLKVDEVTDGSAADQAGLTKGSLLRTINGVTVESRPQLVAALDEVKPGSTVTLEWLDRDGDSRRASVPADAARVN